METPAGLQVCALCLQQGLRLTKQLPVVWDQILVTRVGMRLAGPVLRGHKKEKPVRLTSRPSICQIGERLPAQDKPLSHGAQCC